MDRVKIDWNDKQVVKEVGQVLDRACKAVARRVYADMKRTSAFKDKTGTLRSRIRMHQSRYRDGGYVVMSAAPHTHLVEYGHDLVRVGKSRITKDLKRRGKGRVIGKVPEHSFVRSAVKKHRLPGERYIARKIKQAVGQ